jgi:hypothetical protein
MWVTVVIMEKAKKAKKRIKAKKKMIEKRLAPGFRNPGQSYRKNRKLESFIEFRRQYTTLGYPHKALYFDPIFQNNQCRDSVYAVF